MTTHIPLSSVDFDNKTQLRAEINAETKQDYAASMEGGDKFPPVDLFRDGARYFIGDGWHRIMAAQSNGDVSIPANVHEGGRVAAIRFALSANARHGLKRTNADKAKAVRVALGEWPELSDRAIAEACAVSNTFVGSVRNQLSTVDRSPRKGLDGKTRALPAHPAISKEDLQCGAEVLRAAALACTQEEKKLALELEERKSLLKPSGRIGGRFDSTQWKEQATGWLRAQFARLPADKHRAAAEFVRDVLDAIVAEGGE